MHTTLVLTSPRTCFRSTLPTLLLCLLMGVLVLSGCSTKVPMRPGTPVEQSGVVRDLNTFPQNLMVYADKAGADTVLLPPDVQAVEAARFNERFFSPWDKTKSAYMPKKFRKLFGKAWGYTGADRWTKEEWDAVVYNANGNAFPALLSPAITVRYTFLREMPTMRPRYNRSTPNPALDPFDYMQYSLLPAGMPLYVSNVSRDRQWYFVENPLAAGWVHAADVALVNDAFTATYRCGRYAAVLKDNTALTTSDGQHLGSAQIGAVFPLVGSVADGLAVLVPVRTPQGYAATQQVVLPLTSAGIMPLPITPRAIAQVGNEMLGQPYGWGGTQGDRDCSATTRDLFTPFGLWLPRNSAAQARSGRLTMVNYEGVDQREQLLLAQGTPFMTLVWFKGHIGVYLGKYKGQAAMYHNVWGVRVTQGGNGLERHVIGRCVITSLSPGQELRYADRENPLVSRMQGFSTLPKTAY